jgi:predicted TIM-barrel fold metal-dependent hydrolase
MAIDDTYENDGGFAETVRRFIRMRSHELMGVLLLVVVLIMALALSSWSINDPSPYNATDASPQNWLGYAGAAIADQLLRYLGLGTLIFLFVPLVWAFRLIVHEETQSARRMFGAAMVSPHDVPSAVVELRRAVTELGMKALFLRPNIFNGRPWHDAAYDPLWAACQELGVPVGFHETTGSRMKAAGADRFKSAGISHIATHSLEQMLACFDVIMGGVMERFPRLRFAFLEGQCGWLPFWLTRMDEHYEWREPYGDVKHLTMLPSEYFRRQGFCALECDEQAVAHVVAAFGDDNLVTTTDYPHGDAKYPDAMNRFLALPIGDESKKKILWDNPCRLYGL